MRDMGRHQDYQRSQQEQIADAYAEVVVLPSNNLLTIIGPLLNSRRAV